LGKDFPQSPTVYWNVGNVAFADVSAGDAILNPRESRGWAAGDLDGDGAPELVVGHLGAGGVQAATLDGRPLWEDRTVAPVIDLAIGEPRAAGGGREVLCVTTAGRIVRADRNRQEAVTPGDPPPLPLGELTAGPVAADAAWALLGIATLPGSGRRGVCVTA
jgi:hypothetical protein